MTAPFEADLCPETNAPRLRFNFDNGWSASLVLLETPNDPFRFGIASLAACPVGKWCTGVTQPLGTDLSPEEVAHMLSIIAARKPA